MSYPGFRETLYSVLIVSATDKFNRILTSILPSSYFSPIDLGGSVGQARRILLERNYDLMIINTPLPDEFGVKFAMDIATDRSIGILLFAKNDLSGEISAKVAPHGILVLPKLTSAEMVSQSLHLLCASRDKLSRIGQKEPSFEERMKEIRLINQAKFLLISHMRLTEEAAHHYIEKYAMDRCIPKREAAQAIVHRYQPIDSAADPHNK